MMGKGATGDYKGKTYYLGNRRLLGKIEEKKSYQLEKTYSEQGKTAVFLADKDKILAVFAVDMWLLYIFSTHGNMSPVMCSIVFVASMFFFTAFSFAKFYQYTLMITFDFKLKTIIKNSWLFATLGVKHNIIIGLSLSAVYIAMFWALYINYRIALPIIILLLLFIFPSFRMFLIQFNVFPEVKKYIIDPYYQDHPDEDIEKRRELGLLDYDEDVSVFEDRPQGPTL
jgi:hypothetical protein